LRGVGIDQRLNNQVPLDLKFRDETGQIVTLSSYFGKKPVILRWFITVARCCARWRKMAF